MYMIFPSNARAEAFADNKTADFTIPLFNKLYTPYSENWKVGLMKVQIPMTFYNLEEEEKILIKMVDDSVYNFNMKEGIYETPQSLIDMITEKCGQYIDLLWDKRFTLKFKTLVKEISITKKLSKLLSLGQHLKEASEYQSPEHDFDPWVNYTILLIHCNLVRNVQMDDKQYRLLQYAVPTDFSFGKTFSQNFLPVNFHEIQGDSHSVISFRITDTHNNPIKFRSGNVILTLSFTNNKNDEW